MSDYRPIIYFYDFTFILPFNEKNVKTKLKIPAYSLFQALYYLEFILNHDIRFIIEVRKYASGSSRGNVRQDYKLQSTIDQKSFPKWLKAYNLRKKNIDSYKFKIDSLI